MALTVSQYNSILRQYEEHQTRNRHLHDQRLHHIYETVPGYQALDEAVASTSVAQGKRMLAGDTNALAQLKDQLKDLAQKRASLLLENGYPTDFLDPIYDCPDCQDTGYVNGQKCHCFRQAEIALLYEQSNLKRMLEKENFGTLCTVFNSFSPGFKHTTTMLKEICAIDPLLIRKNPGLIGKHAHPASGCRF